ncbi:hypothetical protein CAPTEDRAFT_204427 [Capitella teleta]|uniref:Uncharacterized protein n=1 Tax=Capitella teleta TaxID=283909 RepID=R7VG97_CAPTE|nr:hypothetical protein CAPTEDRAFT_204427 [Capitella teleta]|eukprot:ELU14685.1 hypothetical protein CAPTEDRAFT_204427 [Capitella teleta]
MELPGQSGYARHRTCILPILLSVAVMFLVKVGLDGMQHGASMRSTFVQMEPPANCKVNHPCEYQGVVDFRVIVMTYNRNESLEKCLRSLEKVDTLVDTMRVEIWIDRSGRGEVDNGTVKVAESFRQRWTKPHLGHTCAIHIREKNAGITGQWTDTWRPKLDSKEIGLLLEDDIDVSPMAYRWLKAVHAKYDDRDDVSGYTIQMQNFRFHGSSKPATKVVPKSDSVFMYSILGTWGFSPHPKSWRNFQDWVHDARDNNKIEPIVPGLDQLNRWYGRFKRHQSMWEMWHIYFSYINKLYCIHPNLKAYTGMDNVMLAFNRQEKGLHYKGTNVLATDAAKLLSHWDASLVKFPERTIQFAYNGTIHGLLSSSEYS